VIINLEVVGIYIGMVIFGLIAYAYIIPYFVVRKIRKLVEEGWAAKILGELIPQLLALKIQVEDKATKEIKEIPLINYLVSVGIQNLKLQLNALKSSIVRGVVGGEDGQAENLISSLEGMLESVPKKWRWAAQMFAPFIIQKVAQSQAENAASQTTGAAITVPYKGVG